MVTLAPSRHGETHINITANALMPDMPDFEVKDEVSTPEFESKTEIHHRFRVRYADISDAIRTGKLAIHLIDYQIKINVAEAARLFKKR